MLGAECDVIFECRVCRNIFRSLANFLSHKRVYCPQRFSRQQHCHFQAEPDALGNGNGNADDDNDRPAVAVRLDSDCTQIVQLERDFAEARPTMVHGAKGTLRDLSSVIERLRRRESAVRAPLPRSLMNGDGDGFGDDNHVVDDDNKAAVAKSIASGGNTVTLLQLDRIAGSTAAVFQTVRANVAAAANAGQPVAVTADSMKTDVAELHYLQQNGPLVVLTEEGKAMPAGPTPAAENAATTSVLAQAATATAAAEGARKLIACDICECDCCWAAIEVS